MSQILQQAGTSTALAQPRNVSVILFPGFTVLDVYGPVQALGFAESFYKISMLALTKNPVSSYEGPSTCVDWTFDEFLSRYPTPLSSSSPPSSYEDILIIPGGFGNRELVHDKHFLDKLVKIVQRAKIVMSVCTGAALLAHTGLLDYKTATAHKMSWGWTISQRKQVIWQKKARWISHIDGVKASGILTSAGVSAGIDASLALLEILHGKELALRVAQRMEYIWTQDSNNDPFASMPPPVSTLPPISKLQSRL